MHETLLNLLQVLTESADTDLNALRENKIRPDLNFKSTASYRAVVIVVVIVFLGLGLFLLRGAPFYSGAAPLLLFAAASSLLLFASWSVVTALTVGSLSTVFSLLHPTHIHGLRGADGKLLHQKQQRLASADLNPDVQSLIPSNIISISPFSGLSFCLRFEI